MFRNQTVGEREIRRRPRTPQRIYTSTVTFPILNEMVPSLLPEAPRLPVAKKGMGAQSEHTASMSLCDSSMK